MGLKSSGQGTGKALHILDYSTILLVSQTNRESKVTRIMNFCLLNYPVQQIA